MVTVTISLPDGLKTFMETQIADKGFDVIRIIILSGLTRYLFFVFCMESGTSSECSGGAMKSRTSDLHMTKI